MVTDINLDQNSSVKYFGLIYILQRENMIMNWNSSIVFYGNIWTWRHRTSKTKKKTPQTVNATATLGCRWFYSGYQLQHHAQRHAVHHIVLLYKTECETIFSHEWLKNIRFDSACIIINVIIFQWMWPWLVPSPHSPTPSPPTIIQSYHFIFIMSISIWY